MIIIFIKRLTWGFGLLLCGSFASFIETITGQFVIDGFWDMQWSGMKIKGSMLGITILFCIITTILQYVLPEANFFSFMQLINFLMFFQLPFALIPIIGKIHK